MSWEIRMSKKESKHFELAMEVIHGKLSITELSIIINKSYRQTQRIVQKIRNEGVLGVIHKNKGRVPVNKTSKNLLDEVLYLLKNHYYDFNLTHFREMLEEKEGVKIGKNIIYKLAKENGLIKRTKRRSHVVHRTRPRMPKAGMLVQLDGSPHQWFYFDNRPYVLIGAIDDATGIVLHCEFFEAENTLNVMKVVKEISLQYGIPQAFYVDKGCVFGKDDRGQDSTQLGRALQHLGCNLILANSPQAKGRIERLWNTMQDRLIPEIRFYQINSVEEANKFLINEFIPKYNQKFSHPPRESESAYTNTQSTNLDLILCIKESRKISSGQTFSYESLLYCIDSDKDYRFRTVNINKHIDGRISYDIMGREINVYKMQDTLIQGLDMVA